MPEDLMFRQRWREAQTLRPRMPPQPSYRQWQLLPQLLSSISSVPK